MKALINMEKHNIDLTLKLYNCVFVAENEQPYIDFAKQTKLMTS